ISKPIFFSSSSCENQELFFCDILISLMRGLHGNGNPSVNSLLAPSRHVEVVSHQQHTGQEAHTAQQSHRIEGICCLNDFNKGVGQSAVKFSGTPHQALHHTGNPHGSNVQHHTNSGDPEMQLYQVFAVHLGLAVETR